jgi:hypothetical protein
LLYKTAVSTPVNLRYKDPDEPKPGDDRQSKEEIKEFGHRSTLSIERDRATPVPLRNGEKLCGLGTGFLKSPDMAGVGMPQFYGEK